MFNLGDPMAQEARVIPHGVLTPRISGTHVVWSDSRTGDEEVYVFDVVGNTEIRITDHPAAQINPAVDGQRVAWQDNRNSDPSATDPLLRFNTDIYVYDLSTGQERQITTAPGNQLWPAISGDRIVWWDGGVLWVHDLATESQASLGIQGSSPAIFENRIAYMCSAGGSQVCVYDLDAGVAEQLTTGLVATRARPDISREFVVWVDNRNDPNFGHDDIWDIYAYDLNRRVEIRITGESFERDEAPRISDNVVVWMDERDNNFDIYAYAIPRHPGPGTGQGGPPGGSPPGGPPGGLPNDGPPAGGL